MTIEQLREQLDIAIQDGVYRPAAMPETNILNAEFSLGKYFAIIKIIEIEYGVETMADIHAEYQTKVDELTRRTNKLYERRTI